MKDLNDNIHEEDCLTHTGELKHFQEWKAFILMARVVDHEISNTKS